MLQPFKEIRRIKYNRQQVVIEETSHRNTSKQKLEYLKTLNEFKHLRDSLIMEKFRRWSFKLNSENTSEFRGCVYGAKVDNLVAKDVRSLLIKSSLFSKKNQHEFLNLDVLERSLHKHCANNGMEVLYQNTKHGKDWASKFCKRHSFSTSIATVVGSCKSQAKNMHKNTMSPKGKPLLMTTSNRPLSKENDLNNITTNCICHHEPISVLNKPLEPTSNVILFQCAAAEKVNKHNSFECEQMDKIHKHNNSSYNQYLFLRGIAIALLDLKYVFQP
jgi:hypothetical protein